MADFLTAKAPTEVVERRWTVPADESVTAVVTGSGITVDAYEIDQNDLVVTLSGGTAAATGVLTVTITTNDGQTLVETLYVPVVASEAQIANTARDYCTFALRKIIGIGETPEAAELDDALERLNSMIATWRAGGADIGAAFPIEANTVIYCPDWAVEAIRYNLLLDCYSNYGEQPTQMDAIKATRGLQLVKHKNLPADRKATYL